MLDSVVPGMGPKSTGGDHSRVSLEYKLQRAQRHYLRRALEHLAGAPTVGHDAHAERDRDRVVQLDNAGAVVLQRESEHGNFGRPEELLGLLLEGQLDCLHPGHQAVRGGGELGGAPAEVEIGQRVGHERRADAHGQGRVDVIAAVFAAALLL